MSIQYVIKKPPVHESMQYTGTPESAREIAEWLDLDKANIEAGALEISWDQLYVEPGSWVLKYRNTVCVIDDETYRREYQLVNEPRLSGQILITLNPIT